MVVIHNSKEKTKLGSALYISKCIIDICLLHLIYIDNKLHTELGFSWNFCHHPTNNLAVHKICLVFHLSRAQNRIIGRHRWKLVCLQERDMEKTIGLMSSNWFLCNTQNLH